MGVRGLQTYLEQYCPDACYDVDLAKLVQEYWYESFDLKNIFSV